MSSERTEAPFSISRERKLTMPLAFIIGLLLSTAAGVAAWTSTREQTGRNTKDISVLQQKVETDHDLLVEIRADIKNLVRKENERQ